MKEREIDQEVRDVPDPSGDASRVDPDARPPGQTESTTSHIFLMTDGEYRCSRCGAAMNDRTLDEACPAAER